MAREFGPRRLPVSEYRGLAQLPEVPAGISVFAPRGVDQPRPRNARPARVHQVAHELKRLPIERVLVGHGPPLLTGGSDAIAAAVQAAGT